MLFFPIRNEVAMLIADELQKIFPQLFQDETAQVTLDISDVSVRIFGRGKNVSFSTPVYFGGNFIPHSVRRSLSETPHLENVSLKTFFTIDEENFRIYLHHNNQMVSMNESGFREMLEEFIGVADEWRLILDENDQNDLIYINTPR